MASRNYNMAFDTPYNRKLVGVLDKYNRHCNRNGEPDLFHQASSMDGGAFLGFDGQVHHGTDTYFQHPHLPHTLSVSRADMAGGRFNFGKLVSGIGKVALPIAERVGTRALEKAVMGAGIMSGGSRPAGLVSPFDRPHFTMVQGANASSYPVYNAVELNAINGGSHCMCGGRFNFGKLVSGIGKVAIPIASKVGERALEKAIMGSGVESSGVGMVKKPRGRPRKMDVEGGKFNFGKALGKIAKGVGKVALPIAERVGTKLAEKALTEAVMGAGVKKARGRPRKMDVEGGKFNLIKSIKAVGNKVGKPFEEISGVNPFNFGYDLGHDVISPAIDKARGVKRGGAIDGRKKRAEIVKKVMKEQGLKMTDASKYVKAHGLY